MKFSKKTINYKLISGGIWSFSSKAMLAVIGLIINALLTRLLTPEEVGAYFLTLSIISCGSMFAQIGLDQSVVRFIAESLGLKKFSQIPRVIFKTLIILSCGVLVLLIIFLGGLGTFLSRLFNSSLLSDTIGLTAILFVSVAFYLIAAEIFRGFQDLRYASVFGGLFQRIISVTAFAFLWFYQGHSDFRQILIISIVGGVTSILISGILISRTISKYDCENDMSNGLQYREMLVISLPLLLSNISNFILNQADIFIIGVLHPQETIAVYGAATRLILLMTMPAIAVHAVVTPLIANLYAQKRNSDLEITLRASAAAAMIPSILLLSLYLFFGQFLIEFIFGEFYKTGYLILIILCFGHIVNGWVGSCGYALMMTGYQKYMMYISIVSGFVTVGLGVLLASPYGAEGVAVATSIGLSLRAITMWLCVKKNLGIWTHMSLKELYAIKSLRMLVTTD